MSASDPKRKSHSRDRGALEEWRNQESFYNAAWRMKPSELSNWVDAYITVQDGGGIDADHPHWWAIERFFELMPEHPDECWQAILAILDREPSEAVLDILGAGPLEDLIHQHGAAFIEKIEFEARENPPFKALLDRVWESSTPEIWMRVQRARGEI